MNTIEQIYEAVKAQLGNEYSVLSSYDATDDVAPDGTIAVNVGEFEHLDHGDGCDDYRFGVSVSGFTLADCDKTRATLYAMEAHVMRSLDLEALKESIDNLAGGVMGNLTTQSDGDSNEFTLTFDLYVAPAIWTVDDGSNSGDTSTSND